MDRVIIKCQMKDKTHCRNFIRTQVFPGNVDGMRFYERNGFCEIFKHASPHSLVMREYR